MNKGGSSLQGRRSRAFWMAAVLGLGSAALQAAPAALATALVQARAGQASARHEGVVESVRFTVLAAQVPGAVVDLKVKAGDTVQAGQLLMRLDARAADQNAAAGDAQVQAARASLTVATQEFQRQQQLYEKRYISQAALERADAQYKATQAQVQAQLAQAGAARTQAGFYVVKAPYAGIVAELPVTLGDMAMPGRALVTVYDPRALRVSAAVPQTVLPSGLTAEQVQIELGGQLLKPTQIQLLPTVDAATHTVTLRASLPAGTVARPGQFARLSWAGTASLASAETPRLYVPAQAVMRRAEMNVVYVLDAQGHSALRQVRVGPRVGQHPQDQVEVLSGLHAGEAVVLDPQAAVRPR